MRCTTGMCTCIAQTTQSRVYMARDTHGRTAVKKPRRINVRTGVCSCCTTLVGIMKLHTHNNVVSILSLHDSGSIHMEYAAGGSLHGRKLQEKTVCLILQDVVAGLAYLHSYGIIHTDIKPANILRKYADEHGREEDNPYLICDFVLCGPSSEECVYRPPSTHKAQRTPPGTPGYMAPEVARGATPCEKSDTWNVGCTALSLCTGTDPWASEDNIFCVMFKIAQNTRPPYLPNAMSTGMESVVCKLLAFSKADRCTPAHICEKLQKQTPQTRSLLSVLETCL